MPLAPGPFTSGSTANINVESQGYDFTDDAVQLQADLAAIGADWDPVIQWLEAAATDTGDVALGIDLAGLLSVTDETGRATRPTLSSTITGSYSAADAALNAAIAFAPAQAWTDPGAPYVPPDDQLTLVAPTLPPGTFQQAPIVNVGGYSGGAPVAVTLTNVTRYGSSNFVVGDQFSVVVTGTPGDDVTAQANFNGQDLGVSDWGPINSAGQLFINGTMGPSNVGAWSQQWYVAGRLQASFNFVVSNS